MLLRGCLACCRLVLPVLDGTNLVLGQAGAGPVQATLVVALLAFGVTPTLSSWLLSLLSMWITSYRIHLDGLYIVVCKLVSRF